MKKRIFSALTALTLALSLMPSAFASEDTVTETHENPGAKHINAVNNQQNFDAYEKTNAAQCYEIISNGSPVISITGTGVQNCSWGYVKFKDMNFGELGPESITIGYAHNTSSTYTSENTSIRLYRDPTFGSDGNITGGTLIASTAGTALTKTGSWTNWTKSPVTITLTEAQRKAAKGTFDLYIRFRTKTANVGYFQFSEAPLTPETEMKVSTATTIPKNVDTTNSVFNAVSQDNDGIHFAMDFGEGHTMDRLRANVSASGATGKIQLREGSADGTVIAELDVSNVSTTDTYTEIFNRISTEAKDFTGVHNLYVTYEGEGEVTIEKLWFKDGLNADIDVLDYTNHSETNSTLDSKNWFPMYDSKTKTREYVKWSEVDFGEASVLRNLNIIMGTTSTYKGVTLNVFIDGIEDRGTQIAEAVNRPEVSSWNDTDNYELVPVTADIKGFHDVYIYADAACPYLKSTKSLNVYSLDFTPETDNYNTYYNEYGDASTTNHDLHHTVTFIPDETTPEKVGFLLALYNSNGRLVRADYKMTTPTEGVNAMTCTLDYTDLITNAGVTDTYTVKGIVWNALTLDPILTYEEVEVATINHTAS